VDLKERNGNFTYNVPVSDKRVAVCKKAFVSLHRITEPGSTILQLDFGRGVPHRQTQEISVSIKNAWRNLSFNVGSQ
jgi:hypothetical protein